MDSINSRTHSVEEVRADLAESRVAKVEKTSAVAETQTTEETPQVQAQKAAPEIDKLRTASKDLAQNWTSLVAAEDGTIQQAPEVDWSAWERAERGLPPEEPTDVEKAIPVAPPSLTGLPEGWTVDPGTGESTDEQGKSVVESPSQGPAPKLEEIKDRLASLKLARLSPEDIQRLTAARQFRTTEVTNQPPPDPETLSIYDPTTGQLVGTRPFNRQEYVLPVEPEPQTPTTKGSGEQIAPPPGKENVEALNSISGEAEPMVGTVPKNSGRQIAQSTIKVQAARDYALREGVASQAATPEGQTTAQAETKSAEAKQAEEAAKERQKLAATKFLNADYGLSARDLELKADPRTSSASARLDAAIQTYLSAMGPYGEQNGISGGMGDIFSVPNYEAYYTVEEGGGSGDSGGTMRVITPRYPDQASFEAAFVDPESGLTGKELLHLKESLREQELGDAAMKKLQTVNLGSFTADKQTESFPADKAFTVIGRDQRQALLAQGFSEMGKAFVLNETGQLILPDEHETGVYFLSLHSAGALQAGGVIDTGNGGLNIDGLYLDGGNAHIGTSRPTGGLFGNFLNHVGKVLPGGKVGDLMADAISDTTGLVNDQLVSALELVGEDKDDFATQAILHQQASVDVMAHAREHGDHTFDVLVQETAEYGQIDQAANAVGRVLVSTGIAPLQIVGAGITVVSGAMMAGHAQLAGDADADPNQGITQAATAFFMQQAGEAIAGGTTVAADSNAALLSNSSGGAGAIGDTTTVSSLGQITSSAAQNIGGTIGQQASNIGTFVTRTATNVLSQATTGEDLDLGEALSAGALGVLGSVTTLQSGPMAGLNAVQGVTFTQAVLDGDANEIASIGTSVITGIASRPPGNQQANLSADEPPAGGPQSGGGPEEPEFSGSPVADDPEVAGPQSGGGPEAPEPTAAIQMRPDALDRARLSGESQAIQFDDGSTLIARPDGTVTSIDTDGRVLEARPDGTRTILRPNGVAVENPVNTNRAVITANSRDDAFAAANALGLGAFEYNGERFHTLREDQIPAATERLRAAIPALTALSDDEMRQLVIRAASQNAMSIFSNNARTNAPGLDSQVIASGVTDSLGRSQETDRLLARFPARPEPLPDNTSAGGLFNEGAESGGGLPVNGQGVASFAPQGNRAPGLNVESPEVQAAIREANARFGELRPASEIADFEGASAQMRRVQERFDLTDYQLAVAVRAAQYSNIGGRNDMPVHDILLGGDYVHDPRVMAAIVEVRRALPQTMPGPDGQPVQLGHAWTGLNGMMNANPISAALMTYAGDYGQVFGDFTQSVARAIENAATATITPVVALAHPDATLADASEHQRRLLEESVRQFGGIMARNYTPDQAAGNALGYRIWWEHLTGGGSIPDAMDRIARQVDASRGIGANPNPVNPDQTNISP